MIFNTINDLAEFMDHGPHKNIELIANKLDDAPRPGDLVRLSPGIKNYTPIGSIMETRDNHPILEWTPTPKQDSIAMILKYVNVFDVWCIGNKTEQNTIKHHNRYYKLENKIQPDAGILLMYNDKIYMNLLADAVDYKEEVIVHMIKQWKKVL